MRKLSAVAGAPTGALTGALAAALSAVLVLAACGTRLPDSAFATPTPAPQTPGSDGSGNFASDTGVTANTVKVGVIVSKTSALGPYTFSGSYYGATAFFDELNRSGGVHGRKVTVDFCDDEGTGAGNVDCAHKLIDQDKVFAFAGVTAFQYDGAGYVQSKGVPDIAGQPIGNEYDQYHHLWNLYGSDEPRDGTIGWDGKLYGGTEVYRWFKERVSARRAGVVFYNVAPSQRFAQYQELGLRAEGYDVRMEQINLGLSNFDGAVADMSAHGVDVVFDALDEGGNVRLCQAMDAHDFAVKAKVTTTQSWSQRIGGTYANAPKCRNTIYATGNTRNYADQQYEQVAKFRAAMSRLYPDQGPNLSMWMLEGWASALWLTDAMASCGPKLTRGCVETYMARKEPYDGHGLLTPRGFIVNHPGPTSNNCLNVAQWQDSAEGGKGGWVTRVNDMNTECFDVPEVSYTP